jgi:hypothetical protein
MAEAEKPPCPLCGGAEVIYVNDFDVDTCRCLKARLIKQHLGSEIASAPTILRSPVFVVKDDEVRVDRTKDNLFIKAPWQDVLPHLKWVFYCKGTRFRFRIVTDEKIRTVFVGNESYRARSKSTRDDVTTFNSLGDLVGSDFDLIIIRLGLLGHKNVAAPGALKEALMLREVACLPTWIVEQPNNPFGPGCHTYSEDVADYIERLFEVVNLTRKDRPAPVPRPPETDADEVTGNEDPAAMESPVAAEPVESHFETPPSAIDDDMMSQLVGSGGKKKYSGSSWKKKSGGGGPV